MIITEPNLGEKKLEKKVLLFLGIIYNKKFDDFFGLISKLKDNFGDVFLITDDIDFNLTDYYSDEMGIGLKKKFFLFKELIFESKLSVVKNITNDIEKDFSCFGKRNVNLDPGILDFAKVILASTKDFSHRIYIGNGVFAEITLIFNHVKKENSLLDNFRFLPWTYPDFKNEKYLKFFLDSRYYYKKIMKKNDKKLF